MIKKLISLALTIMLLFSCVNLNAYAIPTNTEIETLKTEITTTANYLLAGIKENLSKENYILDYSDYISYTMILKSGVSDIAVTDAFLNYLKNNFNADGTTSIAANKTSASTSLESAYSGIILFLNQTKNDPASFNNINFISIYENYFMNNVVNPYTEQYAYAISKQNSNAFNDILAFKNKLKTKSLSHYVTDPVNGTGMNYWGVSADNNGMMFSPLLDYYNTDPTIKAQVDAALTYTSSLFENDYTIMSWGAKSTDSTALALKFFSEFNDLENAKKAYSGLLTFKSADIPGVFGENEYDPLYSTKDALLGMLSYLRILEGKYTYDIISNEKIPTTVETETTVETIDSQNKNLEAATTKPISTVSNQVSTPLTMDTSLYTVMIFSLIAASSLFIYFRKDEKKEI